MASEFVRGSSFQDDQWRVRYIEINTHLYIRYSIRAKDMSKPNARMQER